jgi:hypothetical protein
VFNEAMELILGMKYSPLIKVTIELFMVIWDGPSYGVLEKNS